MAPPVQTIYNGTAATGAGECADKLSTTYDDDDVKYIYGKIRVEDE